MAAGARDRALQTPLRAVLDDEFGGFAIEAVDTAARHDPVAIRAVLTEDGTRQDDFTTLRAVVVAVRLRNEWLPTTGGVILTVGGRPSPGQTAEWRAGRTIETFAAFRRPSRYLNDGVPDFERQLALDGTTLFGSVKSGLLVTVRSTGGFVSEMTARVRLHVRRSVERWVAPHSELSAAIVMAVLIGDRTGLPDEVRVRLQAAGTYHVIAISGGNIAILTALTLGVLFVGGITGRTAALVTVIVLVAYAEVVTAGASVWRATIMAILYFGARLLDHRSPPWHAIAIAAAVVICLQPLDVRDVGFMLTFGATMALLEAARRTASMTWRFHAARWLMASLAASTAAEVTLFPVSAWTFSRVTSAGLVLTSTIGVEAVSTTPA
ncbi:MAG: ComEC/Rec2 family competence protein, partial [Burkholderiales bacterium]